MNRIGQLLFIGAVAAGLALYGLTAPDGLPWNASLHLALAYLGEIARLSTMPHPIWGCYVQVFGGAVNLSIFLAAFSAGITAVLVNRHFGWRFAICAVIVWLFFPSVWNRAITGERSICLAAMAVVAVWMLNAVVERVVRKVKAAKNAKGFAQEKKIKRERVNRIAGWAAIGAAIIFALVVATFHDYRLGEPASVFASGIVEASAGRIIALNGICDDQVAREVKLEGKDECKVIFLRNDDGYRTNLAAWVRREWPSETNLWIAAEVSAAAFAEEAVKTHPDRIYLMNGDSTTLEQWEKRWNEFKPYGTSTDPFVDVARRMFGYEGNVLANAMTGKDAWQLYKRIYNEIDPGNFSALVNMNEMIERGYVTGGEERKKVQLDLEKFLYDHRDREQLREIARMAGPVRTDLERLEKLMAEAKQRVADRIAAGEKVELEPEFLSLIEWNNEMVKLMDKGDIVSAGRVARTILTNPKWRDFIPANAVLGSVTARDGDYVASEAFFRLATETTNDIPAVVLNDYADVLMHLDKMERAEEIARQAVKSSDESFWVARLTLAQILVKKGNSTEVKPLVKSVLKRAPAEVRARVRKEYWDYLR